MIRAKDLNEEIKKLEDNIGKGVTSSSDVVKALCLIAKVVRDIRTNQTTIMKSQGIKLIEQEPTIDKKEI
jgi:hypothetical protein